MPEGIIMPITGGTWHDGKLYISDRIRYLSFDPESGKFDAIINGILDSTEFP